MAALATTIHVCAKEEITWPQIPIPGQADPFDVGKEMVVNGMQMKLQGFVMRTTPTQVAVSMRQILGSPLVEDHLGNTLVLGKSQGQHYITVQLAPLGAGTRALVAVSRPAANAQSPADAITDKRLLASLPPGSNLVNHTSSIDGAAHAEQTAVVNSHSVDINTQYVKRMLHAEGFTLEREARPTRSAPGHKSPPPDTRLMFFRRLGTEAVAVIARDDNGQSVVVLNRIDLAARFK